MVEQDIHESNEKAVQMPISDGKNEGKKVKRDPRSRENKIGRQKLHEVKTMKVIAQNGRILDELRWIRHRLKALGESDIDRPLLEMYAIKDQVDSDILQRVLTAGDSGVLPKDVAADPSLSRWHLRYYEVSRRIVRMNKRLYFEVGEYLFEKRGHRWAVSKFGFDAWGKTVSEVEEEKTEVTS